MAESRDPELEEFYDMLAFLLVEHGGMSREDAERVAYRDVSVEARTPMARMMLLHETPYYWAMVHLHGHDEQIWYHDPALWLPPANWFRAYDETKASGRW